MTDTFWCNNSTQGLFKVDYFILVFIIYENRFIIFCYFAYFNYFGEFEKKNCRLQCPSSKYFNWLHSTSTPPFMCNAPLVTDLCLRLRRGCIIYIFNSHTKAHGSGGGCYLKSYIFHLMSESSGMFSRFFEYYIIHFLTSIIWTQS